MSQPAPSTPGELQPGKIITLPPRVTILNDPKDDRPHVALTPCGGDAPGTLAYGSTQPTEAASSAVYLRLQPQRTGINRNGLTHPTYFYPAILVRPESEHLKGVIGFTKELPAIRTKMVEALGLGSGTCESRTALVRSCRGRVLRVQPQIAKSLDTPFVVVVTGHPYSAERNYLAVVPVYDADALDLTALPDIAVVEGADWVPTLLGAGVRRAAFVVPFTHSIWHATHVASETRTVVRASDMREVEAKIRIHFALA